MLFALMFHKRIGNESVTVTFCVSEPKYADPIMGASSSFQSRLAELASLEAETVRWERLRKLKKKSRDD